MIAKIVAINIKRKDTYQDISLMFMNVIINVIKNWLVCALYIKGLCLTTFCKNRNVSMDFVLRVFIFVVFCQGIKGVIGITRGQWTMILPD